MFELRFDDLKKLIDSRLINIPVTQDEVYKAKDFKNYFKLDAI